MLELLLHEKRAISGSIGWRWVILLGVVRGMNIGLVLIKQGWVAWGQDDCYWGLQIGAWIHLYGLPVQIFVLLTAPEADAVLYLLLLSPSSCTTPHLPPLPRMWV